MPKRNPLSYDVRLSDLTAVLAVRTHASLSVAAQALNTTPSNISKAVTRLERQLGFRLLSRTGRGVSLTAAAQRAMPLLTAASDALQRARRAADPRHEVTVAAPSFLLQAFVPALVSTIDSMRFRGLQLGPNAIRGQLPLRQFEIALTTGDRRVPASWRAEPVGVISSGLFASPTVAKRLGTPTPEALLRLPFVTPVSWNNGQWSPTEDDCPLPVRERQGGHEVPTISLGLAIAAETEQLVFGPRLAARDYVRQRKLVEVTVPGWNVSAEAFLAVDIDRVTNSELRRLMSVAMRVLGPGQ